MTLKQRAYVKLATINAVLVVACFSMAACPKPRDVSTLSPAAQREAKLTEVKKVINDAIDATIAANRAGKLPLSVTQAALSTDWQLIDIIDANPANVYERVMDVIRNARQALPAGINAQVAAFNELINGWLNSIQKALDAAKPLPQ